MNRIRNFLLLVALLVGAAILGAPTQAHALFEVTLTETGGPSVTVMDNVAPDSNPLVGTISVVNMTLGDFTISVEASVSNAAAGILPAVVTTNITAINNDVGVSKTLTITTTDSGFTVPPGGTPVSMVTTLADTSPVAQPTETLFSTIGAANGTTLTSTSAPSSASVVNTETVPGTPYALGNTLAITVVGSPFDVQGQGTTMVSSVPAPAGVVLLLTALPVIGLGGLLSRRRKTAPTAA